MVCPSPELSKMHVFCFPCLAKKEGIEKSQLITGKIKVSMEGSGGGEGRVRADKGRGRGRGRGESRERTSRSLPLTEALQFQPCFTT